MIRLVIGIFILFVAPLAASAASEAVFPDRDWAEATPESQGVDAVKLGEAVACMDERFGPGGAKELVVVRNGYLIHKGPASDACHNVWSCTKTFTSTVLGLLVADGQCTIDDLALKYLPQLADEHPVYGRITLRHLASMSSGYKGRVVDVTPEQPWGRPLEYLVPAEPMYEPGTRVQYQDHQVFILGRILTQLAGQSERDLFQRRVAEPIGMTRFDWGISGRVGGIDLNNAAGTPTTPGVQTTALDMARFGLLYLHRGNWNGRQILPASFVDEATRNQVPAAGASTFLHRRYGFYWWTNDVRPDGKRPWPSAPSGTYTSHGHNCNFCCVVPEWNMVIVRLGTEPVPGGVLGVEARWDAFFARLASALDRGPDRATTDGNIRTEGNVAVSRE